MINQHFAILAALIPMIGSIVYTIGTFKGKLRPNRVSFILWSASPLIAFAAEIAQHANFEVSLLTFSVGFGPLLVLAASFVNKKAYWKLTKFDLWCGAIALLALLLWAITGKGNVAIFFSILSDIFASIPTIKKTITHPQTESAFAYLSSTVGSVIALLTIQKGHWNFASYAFPIYIIIITLIISAFITFPRSPKTIPKL